MEQVVNAVEMVRSVPGARVDRNYGQGYEAVLAQAAILLEMKEPAASFADELIALAQEGLSNLRAELAPYQLPNDYVFFLEFYAGLVIATDDYTFTLDGLGPMTETWYESINRGDEATYGNGLLKIALLSYKEEGVIFFLDLAGHVKQHCVLGLKEPEDEDDEEYQEPDYVGMIRSQPQRWTKLADSFTEWLELVAATGGTLGYL